MMKPFIILSVCLLASLALAHDIKFDTNLDDVWSAFKEQHDKKYESKKEDLQRREIWERNVETIKRHNLEYDLGLHTYTMGINEYSDLTFEEYRKYLLGADIRFRGKSSLPRIPYTVSETDLPGTVDWRQEGYVTGVKNQGQCGSCWAFSSTGALEGQHYKHYKQLVSLSEQNLVDCCTANAGCNGGWMDNSFKYVMSNNGLDNEDSYPYEAKDDTCRYNPSNAGTTCYGLYDVRSGDENALKDATAMNGPVSVAIDAAHPSFQSYKSGIYFEPACSQNGTDHAVLVVGYGNYNGYDYWLVKNSWGTSWGENGYIKMARNYNNMCAIATYASYPLV